MSCPRLVFRCFKALERFGDRVTGAAGPYFVAFAVLLIASATLAFLDVVLPHLPWPWLSAPPCLLLALNLFAHYYYVCTVPPGFADAPPPPHPTGLLWARRADPGDPPRQHPDRGVRWSASAALAVTPAAATTCRKCGQKKPERTHHCRICNRCVLKYDHHCPVRINQCVGLYNERHFVLFMAYLVLATFSFAVLGFPYLLDALGLRYDDNWGYRTPAVVFIMAWVLSAVMGLAVGTMLAWHLWSVAQGETSVEGHDHDVYRRVARERGETFVNSYDLGKRKNLALFLHLGPMGYPWYTLLVPLRTLPYTDGRAWARKPGHERHRGVRAGEELTDDEDDE